MFEFEKDLKERILVLDGAMGTVLQKYELTPEDFNGAKGCYEVLNETRPDIIFEVHKKYIEAGADVIETNSFNCNAISLKDYHLEDKVYDLAKKSAEIARDAVKQSGKKVYVFGSVGPTNKSYGLTAKAALLATQEVFEEKNIKLPISISATVNRQGKLLTGQSMESLIVALDRDSVTSFGFNCSFGAKDLVPLVIKIKELTTKFVSLHANAGLPNQNGDYVETAQKMRDDLLPLIENQAINILGGCCGTNYDHIRAIAELVKGQKPRILPEENLLETCLSGNEIYNFNDKFTCVGERNNISGSKLFRTMIEEHNYLKALEVARQQIDAGAKVLDINVDDGILDSVEEMRNFLRVLQNDSFIAKVPIMIDSSDFAVIEEGLKNTSGKAIVNSISLKEGTEEFLRKAKIIRKFGASIIVMAFDEKGQGVSAERKIEICQRAYDLLKSIGVKNSNIVFDPNILSVGTGQEADRYHAREFIKTIDYIHENLKGCGVVGGLSNLSFAFRGNNVLRAAFHHIFLEEAVPRGFNFAILNPKEKAPQWTDDEREKIKSFIFGESTDMEALLSLNLIKRKEEAQIFAETPEDKIRKALIQGGSESLQEVIGDLLKKYKALEILENILMSAMQEIGRLFEQGELYLPQLIRSASVMNNCVDILTPYLDKVDKASSKGKILMATVDGDVHDIGKNIVGTVLECNGYEVIDLGVMVPRDKIVEKAKEINADVVTLSGLISPSLKEMERVADLFQKVGMQVPVLIAGAATSKLHTGLKVLPNYDYSLHVTDAMDTITVVSQLLSTKRKDFIETKQNQLRKIAKRYIDNNNGTEEKKVFPEVKKTVSYIPKVLGKQFLSLPVEIFKDTLKWDIALYALRVKNTPEEEKTLNDLKKIYEKLIEEKVEFRAAYGYFRCKKTETFLEMEGMTFEVSPNLAQYIEKEDYVGGFVISVGSKIFKDDKYLGLLETLLCNAIAETASEYMETRVSEDIVPTFLRPAVGYPILPDHSLKKVVFDLIDGERTGAKLSPAFAMTPLSTVCGFYLCNDNAKY